MLGLIVAIFVVWIFLFTDWDMSPIPKDFKNIKQERINREARERGYKMFEETKKQTQREYDWMCRDKL